MICFAKHLNKNLCSIKKCNQPRMKIMTFWTRECQMMMRTSKKLLRRLVLSSSSNNLFFKSRNLRLQLRDIILVKVFRTNPKLHKIQKLQHQSKNQSPKSSSRPNLKTSPCSKNKTELKFHNRCNFRMMKTSTTRCYQPKKRFSIVIQST